MLDYSAFKNWLVTSSDYSKKTVSNIISRLKRADAILPWYDDEVYLFRLEQAEEYGMLSSPVRSQIKKAVKLYFDYLKFESDRYSNTERTKYNILSLFANIGVAEAYLKEIGFRVAVANELIERRANLYSEIYPETNMICGDITNEEVYAKIIDAARKANVDIIMATPPCQGMSTAGQQVEDDFRNTLVCPVIRAIKELKPNYVFLENVPQFLSTSIIVDGRKVLIPELLRTEMGDLYEIKENVINTKDYSVPQTRERAIILMSKKKKAIWTLPGKDTVPVTMQDAIGHLPMLDPYVTDITEEERMEMFPFYQERKETAERISKWHIPPHHISRQVVAMQHTPTGATAFDNERYYPVKEDGTPVRGYHNTYKRQNWDTAAYTVTMDNRKISSQNNVHPGRPIGMDKDGLPMYSDARTLTLYEIMIIMSLPENWPVPNHTSEAFLRRIIGEGIPPLFVKKAFLALKEITNG